MHFKLIPNKIKRLSSAATGPEDVVWEPFGGLCSGSVAAVTLGRAPRGRDRPGVR
jgi:hypothetical protein